MRCITEMKNWYATNVGLTTTKCSHCGKVFERHLLHVYKDVTRDEIKYFCCYNCYNDYLKRKEKKFIDKFGWQFKE